MEDGQLGRQRCSGSLFAGAAFLCGAARTDQLPRDEGAEVALAGRSNAGKSSAVNALAGRKALARSSRTPGRTQQINFFRLGEQRRLVDLPGYGYANAPERARRAWAQVLDEYLRARRSLRGMVLLMDVRRPFTPGDRAFFERLLRAQKPICIALAKCDKVSRARALEAAARTRAEASVRAADAEVILFSAHRGVGVDELRCTLARWLG